LGYRCRVICPPLPLTQIWEAASQPLSFRVVLRQAASLPWLLG